jgi:ferredoxin-NADP reductase
LFLSQEEQLPGGWQRGYIHQWLDEALHFLGTDEITVFLCGKPSMVDEVREKLSDHGIAKEHVHFEKY